MNIYKNPDLDKFDIASSPIKTVKQAKSIIVSSPIIETDKEFSSSRRSFLGKSLKVGGMISSMGAFGALCSSCAEAISPEELIKLRKQVGPLGEQLLSEFC